MQPKGCEWLEKYHDAALEDCEFRWLFTMRYIFIHAAFLICVLDMIPKPFSSPAIQSRLSSGVMPEAGRESFDSCGVEVRMNASFGYLRRLTPRTISAHTLFTCDQRLLMIDYRSFFVSAITKTPKIVPKSDSSLYFVLLRLF